MADLDAAGDLEWRSADRTQVAVDDLGGVDHAVGGEVASVDEVDHVVAGRVGAGDPSRALDDARVDDEPDARRAVGAERTRADVALHERRVGGEVVLGERLDLGRGDLRLEPLEVDLAVAGNADRERLDGAVGVAQLDDHVLQRVAGVPLAVVSVSGDAAQVVACVQEVDERGDRRRVGRVGDARRRHVVVRDRWWHRDAHRLGVRRVVAVRAPHERVLADVERGEELLARRATHRARHRRHDHVRQAEAVERLDVGGAVQRVRLLQPGVVDVERVRVLHHELAPAQQPGAGPRLVAELGLDLVDVQRQVAVRRVEILHEEREQLLVRRGEEEVVAAAVLEPEQVVAVLGPAVRDLVRLPRQERREVHLLEPGGVHLLADDVLDVAVDDPPERQPREPARCRTADVAGPHEQPVRGHLGVGRILAKGPQEQGRHPQHPGKIPAAPDILGGRCLVCGTGRRGVRPTPLFVEGPRYPGKAHE